MNAPLAMDDADRAQEMLEQMAELRGRLHAVAEYEPTGECLNCAALVPPGIRWCSCTCRDDHLARAAAERRNR